MKNMAPCLVVRTTANDQEPSSVSFPGIPSDYDSDEFPHTGRNIMTHAFRSPVGLVLFAWLIWTPFCTAAPPVVEGDAGLLRSFRDGLRRSAEGFPAGRMTYLAVLTGYGADGINDPASIMSTRGTVFWTPRGTRWDVETKTDGSAIRQHAPPGWEPSWTAQTYLFDGRTVVKSTAGSRSVTVRSFPKPSHASLMLKHTLRVRPADIWFHDPSEVPWHELMDPDTPRGEVTAFAAFGTGGAGVRVIRTHMSGSQWVLEGNLTDPARVLSYETVDGDPAYSNVVTGGTRWETPPDGGPARPAALSARWDRVLNGNPLGEELTVEVSEFEALDPDSPVEAGAFAVAALDLPPGSRILYLDKTGRTAREEWVGGAPPTEQDALDALAETLKAGDFAGGSDGEDDR